MNSFRQIPTVLSASLTLLSCGMLLSSVLPARASSGSQYVAARRKQHWDRSLTVNDLFARSSECVGKVMELRGTVGGVVETGDGVSVMLNMADGKALTLEVPKAEMATVQKYSVPTLRVLVKVGEGFSNVPPLQVLAVAHDSLVGSMEAQEAAKETARRRAAEQQRRAYVSYRSSRSAVAPPYRGGSVSPQWGGTVSNLVAYYQARLGDRTRDLFSAYLEFIGGTNRRLRPEEAASITYHLLHFADRNNIDPRLVVAMIIAESSFNPNATSRTGAAGLGQLMPRTAASLGVNNPYDHVQNLDGSIRYLRSRLDTFADKALPGGGLSFEQIALAFAAYNAGAGAVKKYHGIPPYRETQAYVKRIISLYRYLTGQ